MATTVRIEISALNNYKIHNILSLELMSITVKPINVIKPVMLCHAACTGGSLVYRILVSRFNFLGVSEISHAYTPKKKMYSPLDPELQMYTQGILNDEQFADIFFKRVKNCELISKKAHKPLLIREHSHRYYFNPNRKIGLTSVSWINDTFSREENTQLKCLISVRDPIDSWLGLRTNFPKESSYSFEEYCSKYLVFIDMARRTPCHYIFKYEDIILKPDSILKDIENFLDLKIENYSSDTTYTIPSTGNSGRQSEGIFIRPRRPYTRGLVEAAKHSISYMELCRILNYQCLSDIDNFSRKLQFFKYSVNNLINFSVEILEKKMSSLKNKFPKIRD